METNGKGAEMKFNEDQVWDGMTIDEVTDLMEQLNLQISRNELWDGMTKDEVIDAIAIADLKEGE